MKKNYFEVLFVKHSDGIMSLEFKLIDSKGNLLESHYCPMTEKLLIDAWKSVEKDGIPFSLGGMHS
jgi:hypothetical protein